MPTNEPSNKNPQLHDILASATGIEPTWTQDVRANLFGWLRLEKPEQLRDAAKALAGDVRLCTVTAYAEERDDPDKRRRIAYHFAAGDTVVTVTVPIFDAETLEKLPVPSITPWFRNADWNEREFREMFDIAIIDHPDPRRLFLDERLDAGIMSKLIPFSAMAHGAASNTLWERVLEAKGVPEEDRLPSLAVPAEPIKVEPKFTPVAATEPKPAQTLATDGPTLVNVAAPAEQPAPESAAASGQQDSEAGKAPAAAPAAPDNAAPAQPKEAPASVKASRPEAAPKATAETEPKEAPASPEAPQPDAAPADAAKVAGPETPQPAAPQAADAPAPVAEADQAAPQPAASKPGASKAAAAPSGKAKKPAGKSGKKTAGKAKK